MLPKGINAKKTIIHFRFLKSNNKLYKYRHEDK